MLQVQNYLISDKPKTQYRMYAHWLSSAWYFSSHCQDENSLSKTKNPPQNHPKIPIKTKTYRNPRKAPQTTNTFPLQILSTSMVKNTTGILLCGSWPRRIPSLPGAKSVSRPQDLNLISVLKIMNWPKFRMDVIHVLRESELVCSALTWTNMTASVYSHICLKALYKFAWNSARDGTELLNDRLNAFLNNLNF